MPHLEVSENYLDVSDEEHERHFEVMQKYSFEEMHEFGCTNPRAQFTLNELEEVIRSNIAMGVELAISDQTRVEFTNANDPATINEANSRDWFRSIFIRTDPYSSPTGQIQFLETFGNSANRCHFYGGRGIAPAKLRSWRRKDGELLHFILHFISRYLKLVTVRFQSYRQIWWIR